MITNNSIQAAKEEEAKNNEGIRGCSSSRQWSRLRNPRIVRVPRSYGGKDRHSKVCTVRGLRDRRIRLSVPTAIQLYDLQDKLGLNQPSKVVDWLLDETKQDIDKLPPLQIPPGLFAGQTSRNLIGDLLLPYDYQFGPTNTCSLLGKQGVRMNDGHDKLYNDIGKFWDMKSNSKQVMKNDDDEKGKSIEVQKVSSAAQSFFPTNAILPYYDQNSNLLSLSTSQFGTGLQQPAQAADNLLINPNPMTLPSSFSLPSVSHHLYLCPTTLPSLFPSYPATSYLMPPTNEGAADTRQVNHFQLFNNNAAAGPSQMPATRYFQANVMNSKYLHHHHHLHDNIHDQTQSDKGGSG